MKWCPDDYRDNATFNWDASVNPILAKLNLQPHERVLDLGCGSGELTFSAIAPRCASVLAVDASEDMIQAAKDLLATQSEELQKKVEVEVQDGQNLPDYEQQFDVCFSNAALHWMKRDPQAVADGVARALKPGGRFVAECGGFGNTVGIRSELHRSLKDRGYPVKDPWFFATTGEYAAILEKAGFSVDYIELVPRFTEMKNGLRSWLKTFSGSFMEVVADATEREIILDEVVENLAVDMRDSQGLERCIYVRLRFVAIKKPTA